MTKKSLIIFDIDGTLLFSNKEDSRIFGRAFKHKFGFEIGSINWHDYPHVVDPVILQAAFHRAGQPFPDTGTLEDFKDYYVELLEAGRVSAPQNFREVKGAARLIDHLINHEDYIVGIATGGFEKPAGVKLRHVGIPTEKMYTSFADNYGTREEIIEGVLTQVRPLGMDIQKTVYVGDAIWDVRTTRNLAMPFIGVKPRGQAEELLREGARDVIHEYTDVDQFLDLCHKAIPPKSL